QCKPHLRLPSPSSRCAAQQHLSTGQTYSLVSTRQGSCLVWLLILRSIASPTSSPPPSLASTNPSQIFRGRGQLEENSTALRPLNVCKSPQRKYSNTPLSKSPDVPLPGGRNLLPVQCLQNTLAAGVARGGWPVDSCSRREIFF